MLHTVVRLAAALRLAPTPVLYRACVCLRYTALQALQVLVNLLQASQQPEGVQDECAAFAARTAAFINLRTLQAADGDVPTAAALTRWLTALAALLATATTTQDFLGHASKGPPHTPILGRERVAEFAR